MIEDDDGTKTIIIDVGADEVNRCWLISNVGFCATLLIVIFLLAGCAFSVPGVRFTEEELQYYDGEADVVVTWPKGVRANDVVTIDADGRAKSYAPLGTE